MPKENKHQIFQTLGPAILQRKDSNPVGLGRARLAGPSIWNMFFVFLSVCVFGCLLFGVPYVFVFCILKNNGLFLNFMFFLKNFSLFFLFFKHVLISNILIFILCLYINIILTIFVIKH